MLQVLIFTMPTFKKFKQFEFVSISRIALISPACIENSVLVETNKWKMILVLSNINQQANNKKLRPHPHPRLLIWAPRRVWSGIRRCATWQQLREMSVPTVTTLYLAQQPLLSHVQPSPATSSQRPVPAISDGRLQRRFLSVAFQPRLPHDHASPVNKYATNMAVGKHSFMPPTSLLILTLYSISVDRQQPLIHPHSFLLAFTITRCTDPNPIIIK